MTVERPADGRGVRMVTLPLDLDDLLAQFTGEPAPALSPQTSVGHVHLKVADVPRAAAFYRDALGLEEQAQLPVRGVPRRRRLSPSRGPELVAEPGRRERPRQCARACAASSSSSTSRTRSTRSSARSRDAETASPTSLARGADGELAVRDPDGQLLSFVRR